MPHLCEDLKVCPAPTLKVVQWHKVMLLSDITPLPSAADLQNFLEEE